MTFKLPNTVPADDPRQTDAVTVDYGPTPLLARFVLGADKAAWANGVRLRVRNDFSALARVNRTYSERGLWYRLIDSFDPDCADLTPENAFWISGENEDGEVVASWAARIYNWPDTNLAEQARAVWYGRDLGQPCVVTAEAATRISGVVSFAGASWVRPDYRGRHLSHLLPRVGKCYACSRWPLDWASGYIGRANVEKGLAHSYGQQHLSYSVFYPGSPRGEQVVSYTSVDEVYADLASFLMAKFSDPELSASLEAGPLASVLEHIVTKTSDPGIFQGSINRS